MLCVCRQTEVDAALVQVGSQMSLSTTVKGLYIASTSIDNLRNTSNLVGLFVDVHILVCKLTLQTHTQTHRY